MNPQDSGSIKVPEHLGCYHNGICCFTGCGKTPTQHIEERNKKYERERSQQAIQEKHI